MQTLQVRNYRISCNHTDTYGRRRIVFSLAKKVQARPAAMILLNVYGRANFAICAKRLQRIAFGNAIHATMGNGDSAIAVSITGVAALIRYFQSHVFDCLRQQKPIRVVMAIPPSGHRHSMWRQRARTTAR